MVPRYTREEMGRIWAAENRYRTWLAIELAVCEAWAERGVIPAESMERIRSRANFDPERIDEIEKITRHDVIAFTTSVAEFVGEDSRFIHKGLTSYDVVDTALSLLLRQAGLLIRKGLEDLLDALKTRAFEHRHTYMIGRSHGIHAEPITFGLKLAVFYSEMSRHLDAVGRGSRHDLSGKDFRCGWHVRSPRSTDGRDHLGQVRPQSQPRYPPRSSNVIDTRPIFPHWRSWAPASRRSRWK